MNDLNIIKQFILRRQELLGLIKPICLILLLDESKAEILRLKTDHNTLRFSENNTRKKSDDSSEQNLIDFLNEHYKSRLEETENVIDSLNLLIDTLKGKLHSNIDYPIYVEKLAYERRREIEWIFASIVTKRNAFQEKCFEILKNLIFGELIRNSELDNQQKKLYLDLISDFTTNSEKWKQTWIDQELPSEELF